MTLDEARRHVTELTKAIAATASIPGEKRLSAITTARNQFRTPVVRPFHEILGISLHSIYGDMLRTYGRACSQALDEIQETDPCTTTC